MRLATIRDGSRDGRLVVVRRDGEAVLDAAWAEGQAMTMQQAIDYALATEER